MAKGREFDVIGGWCAGGIRSFPHWLAINAGFDMHTGAELLCVGQSLTILPRSPGLSAPAGFRSTRCGRSPRWRRRPRSMFSWRSRRAPRVRSWRESVASCGESRRPMRPSARIEGGSPLSVGAARRIGCDAEVISMIERDGLPIDVGRKQRIASDRQRLALHVRDRLCLFPGCGVPAQRTEVHHHEHWALGGDITKGLFAFTRRPAGSRSRWTTGM
jgi:Domain of unknown function (DUF222)